MDTKQSQHTLRSSPKEFANHLYMVLSICSACVTPFIRVGFGTQAPGIYGLAAFFLLIVACDYVPDMKGYLLFWCCFLLVHRFHTLRSAWRGEKIHSRYDGYPWIAMKIPFVRTELIARLIAEPVICVGVGGLLYTACHPFGQFIMACAAALFLKCLIECQIVRKRLQRMRDAEIEQRWYSEQFRK